MRELPADLQECMSVQRDVLHEHTRIMDALVAIAIGHELASAIRTEIATPPENSVPALALLIQAAGSSSGTLCRLSDAPGLHTRDCYMIARSIVEVAVNVCYIIAEGATAGERAMRHARQMAYRDLERESKIGDSVIRLSLADAAPPVDEIEGMAEDIAEFTSKKNREKGWVDASIDTRIEAVAKLSKRAMTALHYARFGVYRHSSEILHGTLYSALYFFGMADPAGLAHRREHRPLQIGQQHAALLLYSILALSGILRAFDAAYGCAALVAKSESLVESIRRLDYYQNPPTAAT